MKSICIILFLITTINCNAQFSKNQIKLFKNISKNTSEKWETFYSQSIHFNSYLQFPSYTISLFNEKTKNEKGNIGVGIYIFEKSYMDTVQSYFLNKENGKFTIFQTKSFVFIVSYFEAGNPAYNQLLGVLIEEIELFLNEKEDNL